eukprot:scaffold6007_cov183-Amphora_coffeaeformis.AAC.16
MQRTMPAKRERSSLGQSRRPILHQIDDPYHTLENYRRSIQYVPCLVPLVGVAAAATRDGVIESVVAWLRACVRLR